MERVPSSQGSVFLSDRVQSYYRRNMGIWHLRLLDGHNYGTGMRVTVVGILAMRILFVRARLKATYP